MLSHPQPQMYPHPINPQPLHVFDRAELTKTCVFMINVYVTRPQKRNEIMMLVHIV